MRRTALPFLALVAAATGGCGRTDLVLIHGEGADDTGSIELVETGSFDDLPDGDDLPPPDDLPPQVECMIDQQCDSGDPCGVAQCLDGICVNSPMDLDEDGYGPFQCGGFDCNDFNPETNPNSVENCFDGDDNDCNGVSDCFDPACEGVPNCGCTPAPNGENCENGVDDDCDGTVDCLDVDCLGTPACGCADGEAGLCVNGFDDDCDDAIDCADSECALTPECQCQAADEVCGNGSDDDCDLLIDCADPDCAGTQQCTCMGPPVPETCQDGSDNDCDMLVDCADPDCFVSPACQSCEPETCDDGQDNDCDFLIDCADPSCVFDPACEPTPEICNNGLDDDFDGQIDCDDLDCVNVPICEESQATCDTAKQIPAVTASYFGDTTGNQSHQQGTCGGDAGEAVFSFVLNQPAHVVVDSIGTSFDSVVYLRKGACLNGQEFGCDDDSGGQWAGRLDFTILYPGTYFVFVDGFTIDPNFGADEGPYQFNIEITPNPPEVCDDGKDNDGDIYVDCGDPDCVAAANCAGCNAGADPTAEFGPGRCTDGQDNDCDGDVDCADEDCSASDYYVTECCTGTDQNSNGIPDDFNCRCNNTSECMGGQMCYTHSAYTCGLPCTAFIGDVCPFVAPGGYCNEATLQCEFP